MKFEFTRNQDGSLPIREAIGQAIGAGSMCWDPRPTGAFDSETASDISKALEKEMVKEFLSINDDPKLGLATTRQLLREIESRAVVHALGGEHLTYSQPLIGIMKTMILDLPEEMLDYRTVGKR